MVNYRSKFFHAQDGLRLHYRDYDLPVASSTPLLCLSGITRNSADFHKFAKYFASTRRIICLDYRGRGESMFDPNWRHYDPIHYLNDIHHLLTLTNLHRAVIVGTSLGGLLAMGMAVTHPAAIAGVILNDVGPDIDPEGSARILRYIAAAAPQKNWAAAVDHVKDLYPHLAKTDAEWQEFALSIFRAAPDGTYHYHWDPNIARPFHKPPAPALNLWALFKALRPLPSLALRGEFSDVLSQATFDRMAAEHSRLIRITIPGAHHAPDLGDPAICANIDRFLSEHHI